MRLAAQEVLQNGKRIEKENLSQKKIHNGTLL